MYCQVKQMKVFALWLSALLMLSCLSRAQQEFTNVEDIWQLEQGGEPPAAEQKVEDLTPQYVAGGEVAAAEPAAVDDTVGAEASVQPERGMENGGHGGPVAANTETAPLPAGDRQQDGLSVTDGQAVAWVQAVNAELMQALAAKDRALAEARAEIGRLKELIRKIWEANRRERVNSHYNMGCVYKACKLYKNAEAEFKKALELDPNDAGTHYNLGVLYDDDLKNPEKARYHYERFLELAPDDKDAARVREWLMTVGKF